MWENGRTPSHVVPTVAAGAHGAVAGALALRDGPAGLLTCRLRREGRRRPWRSVGRCRAPKLCKLARGVVRRVIAARIRQCLAHSLGAVEQTQLKKVVK